MKKILVTGGAGFIGSHIVDLLLARGYAVVVVDDLSTGKKSNVNPRARLYVAGVETPALVEIMRAERPAAVIHQAAQVSVPRSLADPRRDAEVNILGSINLIQACQATGVEKIVFASSAAVYGEPRTLPLPETHPIAPLSPYGLSKYTVERYLAWAHAEWGLAYVVLRYANVYGPRQDAQGEGGVVAIFNARLRKGLSPHIYGDGEQTRDFIYVGDVAAANLAALESGLSTGIFNIATGRQTSVRALWEVFCCVAGREGQERFPAPQFAPPRPGDIRASVLDPREARVRLGWHAEVELAEGLRRLWLAEEG